MLNGRPLTVARPRLATRLPAVYRQPSPKGWHENGAHAVAPLRRVIGLGMHQQWLADVIPGERDGIRASLEAFGPGVPRVATLREHRVNDGNREVGVSALSMPCTVDCNQRVVAILSE